MGYAPPCRDLFLREISNLSNLLNRLLFDIKVILNVGVFPPKNLRVEFGPENPFARGGYNPIRKSITLYGDDWCRKTLIHELFHAISTFSRIPELRRIYDRERAFVEGLTEFFTGYVLFTKYKDCYNEWIEGTYPVCTISYGGHVRLFGAVAQVLIPISDLAKIYVYNPSVDWFAEYRNFLNVHGLRDFLVQKPAGMRRESSCALFERMVGEAIRKKYGRGAINEFMDLLHEAPLSVVLDYSNMLK